MYRGCNGACVFASGHLRHHRSALAVGCGLPIPQSMNGVLTAGYCTVESRKCFVSGGGDQLVVLVICGQDQ